MFDLVVSLYFSRCLCLFLCLSHSLWLSLSLSLFLCLIFFSFSLQKSPVGDEGFTISLFRFLMVVVWFISSCHNSFKCLWFQKINIRWVNATSTHINRVKGSKMCVLLYIFGCFLSLAISIIFVMPIVCSMSGNSVDNEMKMGYPFFFHI